MKITNFCSPYLKKKIITLFFFFNRGAFEKSHLQKITKRDGERVEVS